MDSHSSEVQGLLDRVRRLNEIGIALSAETDGDRLLESILLGAKELTNADGGTLYTLNDDNALTFEIVRTDSLGIKWGGPGGDTVRFPNIPLYNDQGEPNNHTVVAHAVLSEQAVSIADVYETKAYDFSGTRKFDKQSGYRSTSILVVPLKDHEGTVIGALQLINRQDDTGKVVPFTIADQQLLGSLASQAAVALTNRLLIDNLNGMFESLVQVIADAIDEKSPYTGKHCRRVPELTMLLADAVNAAESGAFTGVKLDADQLYELKIAAWLHDCGKVVTPVHVVDKSTRLETIFDRVELLELRYEVARRDARISHAFGDIDADQLDNRYKALDEELAFLRRCNDGGTFVDDEDAARIAAIADRWWTDREGVEQPFLTQDEVRNLSIARGTLNTSEREVINNHVVSTIKMLERLSYPRHLRSVPEIAGAHHERIDGKGYPNGLTGDQMSVQAKILAIADIFEALTSGDRPYKKAIPLSRALKIMEDIRDSGHIDPEIFEVFMQKKVYMPYARQHLKPELIDIN